LAKIEFDVETAIVQKRGVPFSEAHRLVGKEIFTSDWFELSEERVRMFRKSIGAVPEEADMTVCLNNPVGDENVDGVMLISLIETFHFNHNPLYTVGSYGLNYGFDRIRMPTPAFMGQRVRCVCTLVDLQDHPKGYSVVTENFLELEGSDRPALTARWIVVVVVPQKVAKAG
jgi:acyl dehydratase